MKKFNLTQILRFISLLVFSILMPGLFVLIFGQIKQVYISIISGTFNIIEVLQFNAWFLIILFSTILLGRFFCGYMCAFGFLNDVVYYISKKVFKRKFKQDNKVDRVFKYFKFVILALIIAFIWTSGNTLFATSSPWGAFAQIPDFQVIFSDYLIGLILLLFIIVAGMFVERFFCRYLCPLGALLDLASWIRIFKISKPTQNCGSCSLCTANCTMGISLNNVSKVSSGECINCFKCTDMCPSKNAQAVIGTKNMNTNLLSAVVIGVTVVAFVVSAIGVENLNNASIATGPLNEASEIIEMSDNQNPSPSVEPIEPRDNQKVKSEVIISSPIPTSTPNSTKAPINSANISEQPAKITPSSNDANLPISTIAPSPSNTPAPKVIATNKYNDGTYTGIGRGYRPNLKVSIIIKNDKITSIQIISNNETPSYTGLPFSQIPRAIISSQSTNVDVVSGATRTSNGIKEAVVDALNKARI